MANETGKSLTEDGNPLCFCTVAEALKVVGLNADDDGHVLAGCWGDRRRGPLGRET